MNVVSLVQPARVPAMLIALVGNVPHVVCTNGGILGFASAREGLQTVEQDMRAIAQAYAAMNKAHLSAIAFSQVQYGIAPLPGGAADAERFSTAVVGEPVALSPTLLAFPVDEAVFRPFWDSALKPKLAARDCHLAASQAAFGAQAAACGSAAPFVPPLAANAA